MKRGENRRHRAIDPDVDRAELVLDALGRRFDGIRIGDVERQRQRLPAAFFDLRCCGLQPLGAACYQPNLRPCAAKACAVARPTPADAPVMTTVSGTMISYSQGRRPTAATHGQHSPMFIVPAVTHTSGQEK